MCLFALVLCELEQTCCPPPWDTTDAEIKVVPGGSVGKRQVSFQT